MRITAQHLEAVKQAGIVSRAHLRVVAYRYSPYVYGVTTRYHFFESGCCDPDSCQYWELETLGM